MIKEESTSSSMAAGLGSMRKWWWFGGLESVIIYNIYENIYINRFIYFVYNISCRL